MTLEETLHPWYKVLLSFGTQYDSSTPLSPAMTTNSTKGCTANFTGTHLFDSRNFSREISNFGNLKSREIHFTGFIPWGCGLCRVRFACFWTPLNPLPDKLLELFSSSFGPALMVRGSFSAVRLAAARPIPKIFENLFSKKKYTRKRPQGWIIVKCREVEGKIRWNELCPFHEITAFTLTLLEKVSQDSNSLRKIRRIERLFLGENFDPATGVILFDNHVPVNPLTLYVKWTGSFWQPYSMFGVYYCKQFYLQSFSCLYVEYSTDYFDAWKFQT